jgi:hypothetical protein
MEWKRLILKSLWLIRELYRFSFHKTEPNIAVYPKSELVWLVYRDYVSGVPASLGNIVGNVIGKFWAIDLTAHSVRLQ